MRLSTVFRPKPNTPPNRKDPCCVRPEFSGVKRTLVRQARLALVLLTTGLLAAGCTFTVPRLNYSPPAQTASLPLPADKIPPILVGPVTDNRGVDERFLVEWGDTLFLSVPLAEEVRGFLISELERLRIPVAPQASAARGRIETEVTRLRLNKSGAFGVATVARFSMRLKLYASGGVHPIWETTLAGSGMSKEISGTAHISAVVSEAISRAVGRLGQIPAFVNGLAQLSAQPAAIAGRDQPPAPAPGAPGVVPGPDDDEKRVGHDIPAGLTFGDFHALVIGINTYRHLPNLMSAENDAEKVAHVLKSSYGFDVRLLLNPTRSQIISSLGHFRRELSSKDNLLIYYAGHGWLDKDADEGYWLPVDASREDQSNWISNSTITSSVRAVQAKHVIVVTDSCYSGKLARGLHLIHRTPDYFVRMSRKKARVVLSSGGLEPVLDRGGKGDHSIFASAFIDSLIENEGVLDGTSLFTKIRKRVGWNADQTPEYSTIHKAGHEGGDFLFVKRK
jgi:caspase domain-containing protein